MARVAYSWRTRGVLVAARTASWQGPALDIKAQVQPGVQYTATAWLRLAPGEAPAPLRLSIERRLAGSPTYETVAHDTMVDSDSWVRLQGTLRLVAPVDSLALYAESATGTPSFFIDDVTVTRVPSLPIEHDIPALKDVMAGDFAIGAAIAPLQIGGAHGELLRRHFNSVTPSNALKWDATEPTEGLFRFADADALVEFAVVNRMQVRGHTLLWHQQLPDWVFLDTKGRALVHSAESKALLLARVERHVRSVVTRYAGRIQAWDVVNEVIDATQPDGLVDDPWSRLTGVDFIKVAFTAAHDADPAALLCINDYNLTQPAKREAMYRLVARLRSEGVPVGCIGNQMHGNVGWPSAHETAATIERFAKLGVDQQITEMDVSVYTDRTTSFVTIPPDVFGLQAARYAELFRVYRDHRASISSVTLWGLADDDTWLSFYPVTRRDAPLLFDEQLQSKPAFRAIVAAPRPPTPGAKVTPERRPAAPK